MQMQRQELLKEKKTNQGITLTALVVTIVTLLILAGITMTLLLSDGSIIAEAQKTQDAQKIGEYLDRLVVAEASNSAETMINVTLDSYIGELKRDGLVKQDESNLERQDELNAELITEERYIFHIADKKGDIVYEYVGKERDMAPRIKDIKVTSKSTNQIQIEIIVDRLNGGKISYYYKKDSEPEESYRELKKNTTDLTASFTGLEQNTLYNIKVVAENKNGKIEKVISEITGELPRGTISQKGETKWANERATIELETTATGYTLQYQINSREGTWKEYTGPIGELKHGDIVYARLYDGNNASDTAVVNIQDGTAPTVTVTKGSVTTNSITVSVTSSDGQSGMPASPSYSYYIKKITDADYGGVSYTGTESSYTFTGLTQTTGYDVKVETKDNANNLGTGYLGNVATGTIGGADNGLLTGNIVASPATWSNQKASITLSTNTGLTIQWQIGNITEGKWTTASGAGANATVTGLSHGSVVYARLTDGVNVGDYGSVNIADGVVPSVSVTKGSVTTNSITVSVTSSDGQSGMPSSPSYSYYIKKNSDANYEGASYTGTTASYTFTGLTQSTGYDVKVETKDNANNLGAGYLSNVATGSIGGADNGLLTGNIVASPATWNNQKASITLSTNTGLTIQWQIGNITEGKWTTASGAGANATVTGLGHGSVVYARLTDGVNVGDYGSVNIQDGVAPSVSITKGSVTTNSITVSVTSSDGQSGMPGSPQYAYYIKRTTDANYGGASYTGTSSSYTFTGLTQSTGYDITVHAMDNANNVGAGYLSNVATGTIGGASNGLLTGNIVASAASWSGGRASITLSTNTGLTIQWQIGNITEGRWTTGTSVTGLSHGSVVYARLTDGVNVGDYGSVNIVDGIAPGVSVYRGNVSTNSITVSVTSSDGQSGMPGSPQYTYYIKRTTDANYGGASYTGTSSSYTFGGLSQSTGYDIAVHTRDNANNVGAGYLSNVATGTIGGASNGLLTGNIIASGASWSGGRASITLSTNTGLTIQWQIGNITEGRWTTGTSVTGLSHGSVVYARLTDGVNVGDYGSVNIQDGVAPQNAGISLSTNSTTAGTAITATVSHTDYQSGISIGNCKWVYSTSGGFIGTNPASYTGGTFSSNPQNISLNTNTAGTYYLHVLSTDVAGNKRETISGAVTVKLPINTDGSYVPSKGVNSPKLGPGMTPVRWNGWTWTEAKTNDEWYDYSSSVKQWANAKTTDGSLWVWIPRYAYQIASNWHTNTAGTINIKFLQGTSNTAADGTSSWNNTSGQGNWNVHPAFTYGSQVAGIWVAKFEASHADSTSSSAGSSNTMKVQPGVQSWRDITISNIYTNCLNYNTTLNSHQMKNTEWGAVAYLAQSVYGKNSEVWINNGSSFITGSAGNGVSAEADVGTTNDYTSSQGVNASTTGNIYGIYDMNGGANEYVAAYINNGDRNSQTFGANLVNSTNAKTKDVYSVKSDTNGNNYMINSDKYGDAIFETSSKYNSSEGSWNQDSSIFPYATSPFFYRGGSYVNASGAGLFNFEGVSGTAFSFYGFRPVIIVL